MVQNPPEGTQRVIPYLLYANAPAAIEFLCNAFGFTERFRIPGENNRIGHAELGYGDNVLMLATAHQEMGHRSPRDLPGRHAMVVMYVDDIDAHCAAAKEAGAEILQEPADQFYGDRTYRARDSEGHEWGFHEHVKDIAPEDMEPPQ